MTPAWFILCGYCVVSYGSYAVLVKLSSVDGRIEYSSAAVNLCTELSKLLFCLILMLTSRDDSPDQAHSRFRWRDALSFVLPAVCYAANGTICLMIPTYMDPTSFSVLGNSKILSTTLMYRLVMQKSPSNKQIVALILLALASSAHSYGSYRSSLDEGISQPEQPDLDMYITSTGLVLLGSSITLTSFAAVFVEYTYKQSYVVPLYLQNIYLYGAGTAVNIIALCYSHIQSGSFNGVQSIFTGFNAYTIILIVQQAALGFCVSVVMKYRSNITRLVQQCSSIVVSAALTVLVFNMKLNVYFGVSFLLVCVALWFYQWGASISSKTGPIIVTSPAAKA